MRPPWHRRARKATEPVRPAPPIVVTITEAPRCPLCGKVSYDTPAKARKVLKRSTALHGLYRCPSGAWHLTRLRKNHGTTLMALCALVLVAGCGGGGSEPTTVSTPQEAAQVVSGWSTPEEVCEGIDAVSTWAGLDLVEDALHDADESANNAQEVNDLIDRCAVTIVEHADECVAETFQSMEVERCYTDPDAPRWDG